MKTSFFKMLAAILIIACGVWAHQDESRFAKDRVLVMMDNTVMRTSSVMPNLGIAHSEMRLLNPSKENNSLNTFSIAGVNDKQNNIFVITLEEAGEDAVKNALEILNANPSVKVAEPDFYHKIYKAPNDPSFPSQYSFNRTNIQQAWDITTGSESVVVGIIDSGIEGTHPDLLDNLWVNPNPGQNGYTNDIHGYDFVSKNGGTPIDRNGHGTHVAGIVGAKGNNEEGVSGVNWNISLAWLGAGVEDGGTSVSTSAAIEALNYANNHSILITNNSYGSYNYSSIFENAIRNYNGLFVAAAGNEANDNDNNPHYPSSYNLPNVIAVASTDQSDNLSSFSNYGVNSVHIAAPGTAILSTYLNGTYELKSGTSMATPYVAGVAALIKAVKPNYTPADIREILISTAQQTSSLDGFGIVDAYAALMAIPISIGSLENNVPYIDESGLTQTANNVTVIDAENIAKISYLNGWYLVRGNLERNAKLTVSGSVHIILENDSYLAITENSDYNAGIQVSVGNSLSIYAQSTSENMGKLTVIDTIGYGAGIGSSGNLLGNGGTIVINGGMITVASCYGAGIGGGGSNYVNSNGGNNGTIVINGGMITATSRYGAGIGGSIGVSDGGNGGVVTITGGVVTATSRYGAGIGGGSSLLGNGGDGGIIIINGGVVTATGSSSTGIGGGHSISVDGSDGTAGTFTMNGNAVVFANNIGDTDESRRMSGILFIGNNATGKFYGTDIAITDNVIIPANYKLTIPSETTLTIPVGITLTNNGTVNVSCNGILNRDGVYGVWLGNEPVMSTCTVTFDANGGLVTPASSVTGTDRKLASLPIPTRNGYTFNGWFTEATSGTEVTTSTVFNANTTIYAQWTLITYTVTFNANGGAVTPTSGTTGSDWTLTFLPIPTRNDNIFNGWFTDVTDGDNVTTNTVFNANTTIYAQWTKQAPKITDLQFSIPTDHTYTGTQQGIGEVTGVAGMGAITVLYNGITTIPTEIGTYAVTVNITEGTEFTSIEGLSLGSYVISDATPIIPNRENPLIGGIGVQTISGGIVLTNVPSGAKVEVYNLQGALVVTRLIASPQPMHIPISTKGMYIVRVGSQSLRVAVR